MDTRLIPSFGPCWLRKSASGFGHTLVTGMSHRTMYGLSADNPYIVLCDIPVTSVWPKPLADFLSQQGPKLGIKRVSILYSTNNFTGGMASALKKFLAEARAVEVVYDEGVPTETSSYTLLLNKIRASKPDAVVHFGYAPNDIAFLRNMQDGGIKFKALFTIYAGLERELLEKNVGAKALEYLFTFVTAVDARYEGNFGMNTEQFKAAWNKAYGHSNVEFGYNSIAGYNTGLVLEKTLATANSLDQLELRKAIFAQSGKLKTLDGAFELDPTGAQIGLLTPIGQLVPEGGHLKLLTVWPPEAATTKPIYPRP